MQRTFFLVYGVLSYLCFIQVYAYMAAFFGDFVVPKTINRPFGDSPATAVVINLALILVFSLQHSVMARPWFKRIWTRIVPEPIERSTYVLFSCAAVILLLWAWHPINVVIWNVTNPLIRSAIWTLFALGWFAVPSVSLLINHFDLFGVRQVWLHARKKPYTSLPFRTPFLYRFVRHPLYVAWALAFWSTPTMTLGHLLMAAALTAYMVVAVVYEERDLVDHFGEQYVAYRREVPKFVPRIGGSTVEGEGPETATTGA